jgi:hypothetical protein
VGGARPVVCRPYVRRPYVRRLSTRGPGVREPGVRRAGIRGTASGSPPDRAGRGAGWPEPGLRSGDRRGQARWVHPAGLARVPGTAGSGYASGPICAAVVQPRDLRAGRVVVHAETGQPPHHGAAGRAPPGCAGADLCRRGALARSRCGPRRSARRDRAASAPRAVGRAPGGLRCASGPICAGGAQPRGKKRSSTAGSARRSRCGPRGTARRDRTVSTPRGRRSPSATGWTSTGSGGSAIVFWSVGGPGARHRVTGALWTTVGG